MKSLTLFMQEVAQDLGDWCCTSTTRDQKTIARRIEDEGVSFLTITLSNFGSDFQKSLDRGFVAPSDFAGFHRRGRGFPVFLQGFLEHVFDSETGRLVQEPSVVCIWAIRQLTLMWSKIQLDCSPERVRQAFTQFLDCERDVREHDSTLDASYSEAFGRIGSLLWADVFSRVDREVYEQTIIPRHGPGQTAEHLLGNRKWAQSEWPSRLDQEFPAGDFLLSSWRFNLDLSDVRFLSPGAERPVRVVHVPKTLKTPRIIAIEPTAMQYMQQGLLACFRNAIRGIDTPGSFVGNEDQMPNRRLAARGSFDGTLATLDLSEASDRVSNQHVRFLLRNHRGLAAAVEACRSRKADVPDHGVIRLAKFASMGSALTFVMEEIVFSTIIFVGIERALKRRLALRDFSNLQGSVRVFGDDIIVPKEFVQQVITALEAFGLKVNRDKSFWDGKFRESCGGDYYAGDDVSIVKMRSLFPTDQLQSEEIVRTVAFRNNLYHTGMWKSAAHLDRLLERLIPMPMVLETSPVLGRNSYLGYETQKHCSELHRPLVKGLVVSPDIPASELDGGPALLKVLTTRAAQDSNRTWPQKQTEDRVDPILRVIRGLPTSEVDHLLFAGRPRRVRTRLRYGTPF